MNRRNTIQRQLVAEAVRALDHPDAETVYEKIVREHSHISKATVYRNLNLLAEQHEIGKVSTAEGADRFDSRIRPHYHLRCRVCGKLFDTDANFDRPETLLKDTNGFTVEKLNAEFIGVCADCQKKEAPH